MIYRVDYIDEGLTGWYECWEFEPPPAGTRYQVVEESWSEDYTVRTIHSVKLEVPA